MGTKVHCESYLSGYYSMRDLNLDSSSSNWHLFYGDKTLANGQYYNSFLPRTPKNAYPGGDKDALKQTMLEHEAIFKRQVFELHRLYKIQKDMMDEIKTKELHKHLIPMETSSSSNLFVSQMPSEEAWKWLHKPNFRLVNSVSAMPSASGTEIVSSPLSCTKGNNTQHNRIPSQNGCNSKDCEILESRPSKVRKKLFDLQRPADEYLDTEDEEQSADNKISDISSYPPSRNHKIASESSVKLNLGGGAKIDCNGDASISGSCLRNSVGLADLNEPIQVEEAEIEDLDLAGKPKSQFLLGLPKENFQNSQHGSNNGTFTNLCVEGKGIGREWLSHINEAGHSEINLQSFPQGLQPDKSNVSSQRMHTTLNKLHQASEILPSDHSREDLWRERTVGGLELSERSCDLTSFNHLEPVVPSHVPNPYPFVHASDLDNTWSHSVSSWGKPSSSLTQKLTSIQTHLPLNSLATLSRSSQSSAQSHEIFIDKWHLHSSSGSKPGFGSGLPYRNGFYQGSSSGSKDIPIHFPSAGFDYLNCNKDDKVASERSINFGPGSYLKGSNVMDKPVKGINLNVVLSKSSSNEIAPQQVLEIIDEERKCEDHLEVLPWLKAKPASKNEGINTRRDSNSSQISFLQAASNQLSNKTETLKGPNQIFNQKNSLASCDHEIGARRKEVGDCPVTRKILGFPIFDNSCTPKKESSSLVSTSASLQCPPQGEYISNVGKHRVIDINLACDPESGAQIAAEVLTVEKRRDKEVSNFRNFDLNSCVSEDEVTLAPSVASISVNVKIAVEIDLEVPAVPETEEDILPMEDQKQHEMSVKSPQYKTEQPQDEEAFRMAAEAIVAISSSGHLNSVEEAACDPCEAPSADSLMWFVEVVSSYVEGDSKSRGRNGDNKVSSPEEIDYFEAMTLMLREITEEEYMPKSLVPENWNVEETGTVQLPNRPRRGQARRGRQRRDFQRDILPGLASLSRHEVTEDLQTFGGLMRATGHPWQSGLTRRNGTRNGGTRGRRRSVVLPAPAETESVICTPLMEQLNNIVGLEDKTLTGWGKTPRRPRRQRCHAGNPTLITLT
ncbi:hypothetical protein ACSBR2_006316 [Camellia fascicularis]